MHEQLYHFIAELLEKSLTPTTMLFALALAGYFLGRLKLCEVSLHLSGVLIAAVVAGYFIGHLDFLPNSVDLKAFKMNMNFFSSLGTSLFVSAIGLTAGYSLKTLDKLGLKSALMGALMVSSSFALMKMISFFDPDVSYSKLIGAMCGALTTTPGLSAANELESVAEEESTLGYGCSYVFGVIATVLLIQLFSKSTCVSNDDKSDQASFRKSALGGLIQISAVNVFSQLLSSLRFFGFSLGSSGAILCSGILLGYLINRSFPKMKASKELIGCYRSLGLILFFVGNGIPAGMTLSDGFDFKLFLYGALMTLLPIALGVMILRNKNRSGYSSSVLCGGMTSSPAIGVLLQKHYSVDLNAYSAAYTGAMMTVIVLIRLF